jgi:LacI family transcriptional regulator
LYDSPRPPALSLAPAQTHTIAIIVPDFGNPSFQAMLLSLSRTAMADGYRVLVADSSDDPVEEAVLAVEMRRACEGLVMCAPRMADEDLCALLPDLAPVLLINRSSPEFEAPSISVDYSTGIQHLAEHLHRLGHRHLAYLEGPVPSTSNQVRLDGLQAFASRVADVRIDRVLVGSTSADGYDRAVQVQETGATAMLAYNDLVALGLMGALIDQGATVPQEISIAGFDDIPLVRYLTPRLTTASVPYELLGAEVWKRLRARMRGETPSCDVVFQPRLQLRDSTGPAPL